MKANDYKSKEIIRIAREWTKFTQNDFENQYTEVEKL